MFTSKRYYTTYWEKSTGTCGIGTVWDCNKSVTNIGPPHKPRDYSRFFGTTYHENILTGHFPHFQRGKNPSNTAVSAGEISPI